MSIPSKRSLRAAKRELRKLIDNTNDPVLQRMAYAIETTLTWATEDTVGWEPPQDNAVLMASLLRQELHLK